MKHYYQRILSILLLLGLSIGTAFAEGSKDFYKSTATGRRAVLVSAPEGGGYPGTFITAANYPYLTQAAHFAYVKAGESITAASSAQNFGTTGGRIKLTAPNGDVYTSTNNNVGKIADRTGELSGARVGYTPFERVATLAQEGIWKIEFTAPRFTPTSPPDIAATDNWTQADNSSIYAWDVSVFANAVTTTPINGRVYANVLNFIMPQNWVAGNGFYGTHYVLTKEGYSYLVSENGANGAAYTFFVNSKGFTEGENGAGNKTYGSVDNSRVYHATTNPNGFKTKTPLTADDANVVTYKIFYNKPFLNEVGIPATANIAPGTGSTTTWLKPAAIVVPTVSNISFEGVENSGSNVSNKGANIKFTSNVDGTYKIVIPGNGNFIDRVLTGSSVLGPNTIFWDGKAGTSVADPITPGNKVPPGTTLNTVKVQLYGAEIHFPFFDVEINPNGIKIEQLTTDGNYDLLLTPDYDVVYWDDTKITSTTNVPSPKKAILGVKTIHSATPNTVPGEPFTANGHIWGGNPGAGGNDYGNEKAIDTYTFVPGPEETQTISVTVDQADLRVTSIVSSPTGGSTVLPGDIVTYTIVIENLNNATSISDVVGAKFGFEHPAGFTITSAPILTIDAGTVVETLPINGATKWESTLSMTSGSKATYVITGTVGASLKNTTLTPRATILRSPDIADPDATDESTATFSGDVDIECNGSPSGVGCNNIKSPTLSITVANNPPIVTTINKTPVLLNTTITFTASDFTDNYSDVDGDAMTKIKVVDLPSNGLLKLNGVNIIAGAEILLADLGNITFVPNTGYTGNATFNWNGFDGTDYAVVNAAVNMTINNSNRTISGSVYNDTNGLLGTPANTIDGSLYTTAGLNAVLYNTTLGQVTAVSAVTAGAYSFSAPDANYTVYLTTILLLLARLLRVRLFQR